MERLKSNVQSASYIVYSEKRVKDLQERGQIRTRQRYKTVIEKLRSYLINRDLFFSEITVSFLNQYETHLISIDSRRDLSTRKKSIFFELKREKTEKPKLTIEQINKIKALELEENTLLWGSLVTQNHNKNYTLVHLKKFDYFLFL